MELLLKSNGYLFTWRGYRVKLYLPQNKRLSHVIKK